MLISVHLPKTGGSSFRETLQGHYGDQLCFDYGDRPMAQGTLRRLARAAACRWRLSPPDLSGCRCVHGHFLPFKYLSLKNASFATWLRDPVELSISRYYYFKRYLAPDDVQFRRYIKRPDLSLDDYIRIGHFHNVYSKYLFGMQLEDFDFIGITERFGASLEVFRRMYGIGAIATERKLNANPDKSGSRYEISEKLRGRILGYNGKDVEIYRKALDINQSLQQEYLGEGAKRTGTA